MMTADEMKDLQNKFYEAINAGDFNAAERLVSPIYKENGELPPNFPANRDGMIKFYQAIKQAFPEVYFEVFESKTEEDLLKSRIRVTGLQVNNSISGQPVLEFSDITRIDMGMAFEHWVEANQPSLVERIEESVPVTGKDKVQKD